MAMAPGRQELVDLHELVEQPERQLQDRLVTVEHDEQGRRLPYLNSVRLSIQQNRELEAMRFQRGELDLMTSVSPEIFDQLQARMPSAARDLGPSLESEMLWFNQVAKSPLPDYKKAWFRSRNFRLAISSAIRRDDQATALESGKAALAEL